MSSTTSADENKTATEKEAITTSDTTTTSTTEEVTETITRTIDEVVTIDGGKESHIHRVITEKVVVSRNKKASATETGKLNKQEQLSENEHKQEKDVIQSVTV